MPKSPAQLVGPAATRTGAGDATRTSLLQAAASLVAQRGWGAVTTRAVAERAGVNQALVHYHFGSIEHLRQAAVMARLRPEIQGLADELLHERPMPESISRVMQRLDRFDLESEAAVLMAEALLRATRDERFGRQVGEVVRSWSALLEPRLLVAQQRGVVRQDIDAASLARILAAVLDGFIIQRMADPAADPAAAAGTLIRLLTPVPEDPA